MIDEIEVFYSNSYEKSNLKEHFHNGYEIVFIKEGSATFKIGKNTYNAYENSIVFIGFWGFRTSSTSIILLL